MTNCTNCTIYARYSPRPGEPDEIHSNKTQIAGAEERCRVKGYLVRQVEQDEALTGLDELEDPNPVNAVLGRPGLLRAIESIHKGDVLMVRWRNRLARDPYIQAWVRRTVAKRGGRIEAWDEPNEVGLAGELLEGTLAVIDKYKAIQIGIDTALAMNKHQNVEHRLMSRPDRTPYGWRVDPTGPLNGNGNPGLMVPDYGEQQTVELIGRLFREGLKPRSIARTLDGQGVSRRGKLWVGAESTIKAILKRQP
jgi:hypothetical protein